MDKKGMDKKGFICTHCGNKKPKLSSALKYGLHHGRRQQQQQQQQRQQQQQKQKQQQQKQQYGEQRYLEGVSDVCNVCKGLTFFLNLDDNSDDGQQMQFVCNALEVPSPTKRNMEYKRGKERRDNSRQKDRNDYKHKVDSPSAIPLAAKSPHHYYLMEPNKRSRSCVPMQTTDSNTKRRRSQSMARNDFDWIKFVDLKQRSSPIIREVSQSSDYQCPVETPHNSLAFNCLAIEVNKSKSSDQIGNINNNMLIEDPDDAQMDTDADDDDDDDDNYRKKAGRGSLREDAELPLQKLNESILDSTPSSRKDKSKDKDFQHQPKLFASRNESKLFHTHKDDDDVDNDDKSDMSISKKVDLEIKGSDLELQMSLAKKRELISKLCAMRERLDKECQRAKTELYELQYKCLIKNNRDKQNCRERGGALINSPEICKEKPNGERVKDKVISLDNQLLNLVRERQPHKYPTLSPEPELQQELTPICSSGTVSTVDAIYKQPSSSLRVLMSPKLKNFLKSSSRIITPNRKVPQACFSISYVQRAKYSGFISDPRTTIFLKKNCFPKDNKYKKEPPLPQFTTVPCSRKEVAILIETKPQINFGANVAREFLISRAPIHCPDFDCKRLTFMADFNRHLLYDHRTLTIERISLKQPKTFFLDPNITLLDRAKCHMLYLVKDKVFDSHSKDLSKLLPVLVMTARVRMSDMYGFSRALQRSGVAPYTLDTELFLIWLTSFVPKTSSITGTISVWSTRKAQTINTLYVHTSEVYDVRAPQDMLAICHSTSSVVIPTNVIRHMTNNGENLLAIQVQVY